jgi:hypothetical protein
MKRWFEKFNKGERKESGDKNTDAKRKESGISWAKSLLVEIERRLGRKAKEKLPRFHFDIFYAPLTLED